MKFKEVFLVVVLILAGLVLFQFKTGKWNLDDVDWNWGRRLRLRLVGREYAVEETRTIEAPLPPAIEIENGHGWVEVRGADQDDVQLTFKKVVWRKNEEEAKDIAGRLKYELTAAADKLTLEDQPGRVPQEELRDGLRPDRPAGDGRPRHQRLRRRPRRRRQGGDGPPTATASSTPRTSTGRARSRRATTTSRSRASRASAASSTATPTSGPSRSRATCGSRRATPASGSRTPGARPTCAARTSTSTRGASPARSRSRRPTRRSPSPTSARPSSPGNNMAVFAENVRGDLEVRTSYEPVQGPGHPGQLHGRGPQRRRRGRRAWAVPRSRSRPPTSPSC
ncbi:MAG: hypothetical protein M0C28_02845 [Candidatus Moduliflexus flocculans]|nr:hypothetical protein [Candidatus Moduliflexus flocculans]